ncbi:hypothetical protein LJR290_003444 [Variovorax sp. LjRoot290]|uniref:hypothetical protein n=1 Tax=Variovorax sp. LjRoot290 TaxID=3342316 RepID=UPI003ECF41CF
MTTNHIAAVKAALSTVTPLADQLRAMQAAVTREADLKRTLANLEAQQAEAERAAANNAAAIARFQNIRIVGTGKGNPRMDNYTIHYNERAADLLTMQPVWRPGEQSLTGPTPELYAAVLADPSVLPPAIRALDADPDAAVRRYFGDKARGYVRS